jgi:hypothetical protein
MRLGKEISFRFFDFRYELRMQIKNQSTNPHILSSTNGLSPSVINHAVRMPISLWILE